MRRMLAGLGALLLASGSWRPGERVLLSDFSVVTAVAASSFKVYAATLNGLIIYDRGADRWDVPQTVLDGYPTAQVRVAIADPIGNGVWLGTTDGWAHYDEDINLWDSGILPGGVRDAFLDSQDPSRGLYVLGIAGWNLIPRGGLMATPALNLPPPNRRLGPLSLRAALTRSPVVDAMRARLLTDTRLRNYQYTSAAQSPERPELFLGTNGLGVLKVDANSGMGGPIPFGLPNARASVVVAGPGGVWTVGSARAGERRAVTWVADDLARFEIDEDALGRSMTVLFAQRLLYADNVLWLGTDHGVYQIAPGGGDGGGRLFDLGAGLPGQNVLSLARAPDGVWVGTTQGLAVITGAGVVTRLPGYDRPVPALVAQRESLWVGTADGLALIEPGATSLSLPAQLAQVPTLRAPIVALANAHDTIVAATADQLGWRDAASGTWTVLRPRAPLGTITALAPDGGAGGVWIAGTSGLAFWDLKRQTFRGLSVPQDIPAAVRDLTVEGDYIWIATDAGLVRLSRDAALHH